jgi:germination protein YpeB
MQKNKIWTVATVLALLAVIVLGYLFINQKKAYAITKENEYNMAFYEVVEYVQNLKTYLAKSMISKSAEHGAEMFTHVWREANLAQAYLGMLPIESQELENTEKYLNQLSEYSYSLSRKNIEGEGLTDEEMNKIRELYNYSNDLANILNQMADELNNGIVTWEDLMKNTEGSEIAEVSTFDVVEENFHEYTGLIYDGAFSEHITSAEKRGLVGEEIDEDTAKQKAEEFIGKDKIQNIQNNGYVENGDIPVYRFEITTKDNQTIGISVSKKGGYVVYLISNREIKEIQLDEQEAIAKGKEFLASRGFDNMQETYYMKQDGFITINYAYKQGDVVMYADLIKAKIALDNGEIIGLETTGYLNSHYERQIPTRKISIENARDNLNENVQITNEAIAMIPTEWKSEKFCYEFKGKIDNTDFIAYINAETGEEEDILIITNSDNGTLVE